MTAQKKATVSLGRVSAVALKVVQNDYHCGVGQTVIAIVSPLRYLEVAKLQDKQSIAQNPVYLAIASQMHCEISPRFVADHQIKTNLNCYLMGQHRVLSVSRNDDGSACWTGQP